MPFFFFFFCFCPNSAQGNYLSYTVYIMCRLLHDPEVPPGRCYMWACRKLQILLRYSFWFAIYIFLPSFCFHSFCPVSAAVKHFDSICEGGNSSCLCSCCLCCSLANHQGMTLPSQKVQYISASFRLKSRRSHSNT